MFCYKRISNEPFLMLVIPLALSAFTHLWNPVGFLEPSTDETAYISRTLHLMVGQGPQEGRFYDHPYFGQFFLAAVLKIVGYPNSLLHPTANGDVHSIEMLWIVPRVIMGLLAVVDTFLVFKISEVRYNRKVGFIASILFAVMPITLVFRRVWLEPIQLPFLLSSILFALYHLNTKKNESRTTTTTTTASSAPGIKTSIPMVLLSGIFLGLAIFTKIPAFTMIPLVAFLVYINNNRNLKLLALWFIPVILIPLIWPAYALYTGEFGNWLDGVYTQSHRTDKALIADAIKDAFITDPVLMILGLAGLVFAVIKKDFMMLLWVLPFMIFLFFIGYVQFLHLIPLIAIACIASARLIEGSSDIVSRKNSAQQRVLPFVIVAAIGISGLTTIYPMIMINVIYPYFQASAFLSQYLKNTNSYSTDNVNENNSANKITVISTPFYSWIPQYIFHLNFDYEQYYPALRSIKNEKIVMVTDQGLMGERSEGGQRLQKIFDSIYNSKQTKKIAVIGSSSNPNITGSIIITSSDFHSFSGAGEKINLIGKNQLWKRVNYAKIMKDNGILSIYVKTADGNRDKVFNRAYLQTQLNLTKRPLLLYFDYYTSSSLSGRPTFYAEIRDNNSGSILWDSTLDNTDGKLISKMFILPNDVTNRQIKFILYIITDGPSESILTVRRAMIM
jgi:hypothetical protein